MDRHPLLVDYRRARAVLVATGTYRDPRLPAMPQAVAGLNQLVDDLTGPVGLFRRDAVRALVDPQSPNDVLEPLARCADGRPELLLLCYLGHGVLDTGHRLHLALPGTDQDRIARTALPVESVLRVLDESPAVHRVALLDCCFAGLALQSPAAARVHLLTAADATRKALFPPDAALTGFTAALHETIRTGVPDGPEYLDLALLYQRTAVALAHIEPGRPRPLPVQRSVDASGGLALARNRAHDTGLTREGLLARARFAQQMSGMRLPSQPWWPRQAVGLFAGIVADAARALPPTDRDTLRYRHAHAVLVARHLDRRQGVSLLERLVADMRQALPPGDPDLAAAHGSHAHWSQGGTNQPGRAGQ